MEKKSCAVNILKEQRIVIYNKMFLKLKKNKKNIKKIISKRKKFIKIKKQYDITGATIKIIDNSGADMAKL